MSAPSPAFVRRCPHCGSERPVDEIYCGNRPQGTPCHWPLSEEEIVRAGETALPPASQPGQVLRCGNGHPLEPGDQLCLICGGDPATPEHSPAAPAEGPAGGPAADATAIDGWLLLRRLHEGEAGDTFAARRLEGAAGEAAGDDGGAAGEVALTLYRAGAEPDRAVQQVLRRMPDDHVPRFVAAGRFEDRAYEVVELVAGGALADAGLPAAVDTVLLRRVVDELGRALESFAELSLRHRDLHPGNILLRRREPLDLVITGFGSARLSDFDLEAVAPLELTRYSAPETIVGAVSAASDWWSLGMVVLELATAGACFEGVNDQAFRLHVVTRGIALPAGLDPDLRLLLRGLLARDPLRRWSAPQVRAWLAGEAVDAPPDASLADEAAAGDGAAAGKVLALAGRAYRRPELFALAAAEGGSWEAARELTLRGAVATWLAERGGAPELVAQARRLLAAENVPEDFRHALTLMAMNPDLPLTVRGEIVTPGWLLAHPREGYELIAGEVPRHLERLDREPWLVRLRTRAEQVRDRARLLAIALDEERLRIALLATSRANLEAERDGLRRVYPDAAHAGLASILERGRLGDEDLILLVGAATEQLLPLETLVAAARELAARCGVPFDDEAAAALLVRPRREIFAAVDARTANFARCGHFEIDAWAESFRVERRLPLPRAAVLLGLPPDSWKEPPKQQYVATLLEHFEKRVAGAVSRGPLARFAIGKSTPRVDIHELGTGLRPAEALLNHVLSRTEVPVVLDPAAYREENLEGRLRRMASQAIGFRRDTGLDGRILGFPFLLLREARAAAAESAARPRLLPVLLWPVAFEMPPGAGSPATLMFDREREEIRLNPALEGLLGAPAMIRWREARDELLGRSSLKLADAMDVFGALAPPRGRVLARLPGKDVKAEAGAFELLPSAALFNAEFTGQSVAEDLRRMRQSSPAGTGLEAILRVAAEPPSLAPLPPAAEKDRYLVVESDPSQEAAVQRSRLSPGLLVEGPPGTGKSQTIVNVIADAVGRGQTVLVVCQKQAALQVVKKRLEAEGLGDRLFLVVDINKDRELVMKSLREQLGAVGQFGAGADIAGLRRQREEKAARIEVIEAEIDRHHQAMHQFDELAGATYRELLGELMALEAERGYFDAGGVRQLFQQLGGQLGRGELSRLEETCAPLARLWLASKFEQSPLAALRPFAVDATAIAALTGELQAFVAAEESRREVLASSPPSFETDDPAPLADWLRLHGPFFQAMQPEMWSRLAAWQALFRPRPAGGSLGREGLAALEGALAALEALPAGHHDEALFRAIGPLEPAALREQLADAAAAVAPASFLGRLSPVRWLTRRRVRQRLAAWGEEGTDARMEALRAALELESRLRPIRLAMAPIRELLGLPAPPALASLPALRREAELRLADLRSVAAAAAAIDACPRPDEAAAMVRAGGPEAFLELRRGFAGATARHGARRQSRAALEKLGTFFSSAWTAAQEERIARGEPTREALERVIGALDTLEPYQEFRSRAAHLEPAALRVFAQLRAQEAMLLEIPAVHLGDAVRRTLHREALLAGKGRIEAEWPELRYERDEIERKVKALGELDRDLRQLNQELLSQHLGGDQLGGGQLGSAAAWEDLTRLRGPRARRLRELMAQGKALGLLRLRPIWLMNPDVASRVLPLEAGFFDLVVYDEASQMPVEHAVPTLFRARRILVSGDEKQMPPTRFFAAAIDEDEEDPGEGDLFEEAATELERIAFEESCNRREVKDCPDLLQLGRGVLPATTLQIHYRSQYRELIGFSNAAFYRGELSVPVRHPHAEVRRVRPIEVVRVEGIYEEQTNGAEAAKVVELVAELWAGAAEPPSLGVVTFNRKQADLVETLIEKRAYEDKEFLRAYQRERERTQNGEDMSFFVKNVENVQGDERDVILFSTTFGRDRRGAFRRNFGVLGQAGGERRLNVAVTRARQKVVLVTSMPVRDVSDWVAGERPPNKPRDFLQAYLDYAERLSAGNLASAEASAQRLGLSVAGRRRRERAPDGFQQAVGEFLHSRGWQWVRADEGDAFGLDFAIEDERTGLFAIGIECDAPRQALLERARAREIWRPKVLRRAIPVVHRVSSRAWYHRPQEERERLAAAVEAALGQPASPASEGPASPRREDR